MRTAIADLDEWVALGEPAGAPCGQPEVLGALADLARQALGIDEAMTIGGWLAWLPSALGRDGGGAGGDAVTVCSFHRAKGLEWSAVWICGLEEGLVPIGHAVSQAARAEERRLLYVAMTRARHELHCSWAEVRSFGARHVPRRPSPWLSLLPTHPTAPAPEPPSALEWARRLRLQRDRLRAGGPPRRRPSSGALPADWPAPDARLLDALRTWRGEVARASAVPAHVVLHDTVLTALAALRPSDHEALLGVPGLGPMKADRFGPRLLALVAEQSVPA